MHHIKIYGMWFEITVKGKFLAVSILRKKKALLSSQLKKPKLSERGEQKFTQWKTEER